MKGTAMAFMFCMSRAEVSEQIAVALVRLQQDMNSVLTRLNTLEALSVAQTRIRSRTPSEAERERQAQVPTQPAAQTLQQGTCVCEQLRLVSVRPRSHRTRRCSQMLLAKAWNTLLVMGVFT